MSKLVAVLAAAAVLLAGCGSLAATGTAGPTTTTDGVGFPAGQLPTAGVTSQTRAHTPDRLPSVSIPKPPTNAPATGPSISANTAAQRLHDATHGAGVTVAPARGGYQAIAWDQSGNVAFYQYTDDNGWKQIGQSTYPNPPGVDASHPNAADGAVLSHMVNATFILHGLFTGDGTGNAIAFTADNNGRWGAVKAEPNGNIGPSGQGVDPNNNIGLEQAFYFSSGQLESADCSNTLTTAECGGNQRVFKYWEWNGTDFSLVRRSGLAH